MAAMLMYPKQIQDNYPWDKRLDSQIRVIPEQPFFFLNLGYRIRKNRN